MTATFRYTARRYDGEPVAGTLEVDSRERAVAQLQGRALFVTSLDAIEPGSDPARRRLFRGRSDRRAPAAFMRAMATLIAAGVALRRSVAIAAEQCTDDALHEALQALGAGLDGGGSLADGIAARPRLFPSLAAPMIRAGERAGALAFAFECLAEWTERDGEVRGRISAALAYPAFVALAAAGLLVLLIVQTVPALAALFVQMNVPLPASTRALLWISHAATSPRGWLTAALVAVAAASAALGAVRSTRIVETLERAWLRAPVAGTLVRRRVLSRLARCLSMLLRCGVEFVPALAVCDDVAGYAEYRAALAHVRGALREGQPVSGRLDRRLFDPLFVHFVKVGEETGQLDVLLERLAGAYDAEFDASIRTLSATIEPALILVLGAAIGSIAVAVLVPFYSLVGSIR